MDTNAISQALLKGLQDLEQAGDLVITHTSPQRLAEDLCSTLIERWAAEFADMPPHEVVIADSISWCTRYLQKNYDLPYPSALFVVERFVEDRGKERTLAELAELLAHQGHQEIAMGAYYCVHLDGGTYYDMGYLEWRKKELRG